MDREPDIWKTPGMYQEILTNIPIPFTHSQWPTANYGRSGTCWLQTWTAEDASDLGESRRLRQCKAVHSRYQWCRKGSVCSTNPHIKCCAFSRDVAWHDCLGSACADFAHLELVDWELWLLKKCFCNLFLRLRPIHAPISKTEKNIHGSSILSQMTKRNSSKKTACLLAAQSWDLASAGRAGAGASGGESP